MSPVTPIQGSKTIFSGTRTALWCTWLFLRSTSPYSFMAEVISKPMKCIGFHTLRSGVARARLLGPGTNTAWYEACGTPFSSQAESCYQALGSVLWRRWVLGVCGSTQCPSLRESFVLLSSTPRDGPIWPWCLSHPAVLVLLPTLTSGCLVPFLPKASHVRPLPHRLYVCLGIHLDCHWAWLSCCTTP